MFGLRQRALITILCQKNFSSHFTEPFWFSKNLWYWKISTMRWAVRLLPLSVEIFCLRIPKWFVEPPFCVPETFWYAKFSWIIGGGGGGNFSSKLFFQTVPKLFIEEPFCVSEAFWYGNNSWIKRGYHDFRRKHFVSQYRNFSYRITSVFQKLSDIQRCLGWIFVVPIMFHRRNHFCLTAPEN